MNWGFTGSLYLAAAVLLAVSFRKSREKSLLSLKKAWKMFLSVLPQFFTIVVLAGLLLAFLPPEMIRRAVGGESGFAGMLAASLAGSVSVVPVVAAFPIAAELLHNGAGTMQVAVFLGTLTTVGLVTLPLEFRYLGKKAALLRNVLFFLFSFVPAFCLGVILP